MTVARIQWPQKVYLDGKQLPDVTGCTVEFKNSSPAKAVVEIQAHTITVEYNGDVIINTLDQLVKNDRRANMEPAPGRDLPRRCYVDLYIEEERNIQKMVNAVEDLGAHPILTDVVVMLGQAKDRLADWVDIQNGKRICVAGVDNACVCPKCSCPVASWDGCVLDSNPQQTTFMCPSCGRVEALRWDGKTWELKVGTTMKEWLANRKAKE